MSLCITDQDKNTMLNNSTLKYISLRQNTSLPFLPICGENEKRQIHLQLSQALINEESLTHHNIFHKLSNDWNSTKVSVSSKNYPKLPTHFARYVKRWWKNQDRRDAAIASGANKISTALEYVPLHDSTHPSASTFATSPFTRAVATTNLELLLPPPQEQIEVAADPSELFLEVCGTMSNLQPPKKRTCQVKLPDGRTCPYPKTCRGKNNRKNCTLYTGGDVNKLMKRKIVVKTTKHCAVCFSAGCGIGIQKRQNCPLLTIDRESNL